MKKLLFILIAISIANFSFSQNKKKTKLEIPKKTNLIEVTTNYSSKKEALNVIVRILLQEGIEPEKIDSSSFFITTGAYGAEPIDVKLMFSIKEKVDTIFVSITGKFIYNIEIKIGAVTSKSSWSRIEYKGMQGSPIRKSWDLMHKFTILIPNKNIKYIIK